MGEVGFIERKQATCPPILPPFLRGRRDEPERRIIILPDIIRIEDSESLYDHSNNWITTIYHWMNRVTGECMFSPDARWECAHTSSRRYRQWLETYETKDNIPPHIQFGGAIKSGSGDPTFHSRWLAYARETFA